MSDQEFDSNGIKMLHKVTGNKVEFVDLEPEKIHKNGKRYNVNHKFLNYMMIGYFKTGNDQDVMEMKTDGPNHGGCNDEPEGDVTKGKFPIEDCCWVEVNVSLTDRKGYKAGQFYIASEHPHPKNFDAPESGKGKVFKIKSESWIGYAVCAWQDGLFRHLQGWIDTDPFNEDGTPKNGWELGIDQVDEGQLTTPHLAKRKIPIDHVKDIDKGQVGLECEIRMNNATDGDTEIKFAKVYEIIPPS